jgi:ribulose-5-phosphate 4-epimerase/fuculose-1-phosphate aldolase
MLTSMGDVMREAHKRGWITTRDGNISVRRQDKFYITPSGVRKTVIIPEMIIKGKVTKDGLVLEGSNPSGELEMHELLQTNCKFNGCRAVVHLHPTYTIAAMHRGFNLQELAAEFPEVSRYTRVALNVPVLPVTSSPLAAATFNAMTMPINEELGTYGLMFDIVGQAGHGVTAIGKSPWDAFEHIERLEHICQIVLASGVSPK